MRDLVAFIIQETSRIPCRSIRVGGVVIPFGQPLREGHCLHFMKGARVKVLLESNMPKRVISSEAFPDKGYKLNQEKWDGFNDGEWMDMEVAYSLIDDSYIGDSKEAEWFAEKGIKPEASKGGDVACIGFCEKEQKWYGWSHRARYGFGIGDKVKEGDCCASSGYTDDYLAQHPEENGALPVGFEAKTLEDAKRMAVAFADSVS